MATGIPELREAIGGHHAGLHGLDVSPDDVVVTTGSSGGFLLAFLAAFEAGDRVAIARPGYPCYRNVLTALGCEVVELPTGPASASSRPSRCSRSWTPGRPVQGLVVASPANPTGTMLLPEELAALAAWCEEHGVRLISDEIYHGITYDAGGRGGSARDQPPVGLVDREAVVFNSFSKYFSMTGWRIGWMLVPARLRRAVDVLTGNFTICPPVLSQHAALAAFTDESYAECDGHVRRYAGNRSLLLERPARAGHRPAGAGRRRVLRLRRRRAPHRRLDGLRPPAARRDRRGARARHRLRHRRGRPLRAVSLRREPQDVGVALERLAGWLP